MTDASQSIQEPSETLPITLLDAAVLAARGSDGAIYLSCRDVCQAFSVNLASQLRRLRNHAVLREGLARFRVPTHGGPQAQDFLLLEHVPTWLVLINSAQVSDSVRERLVWYQRYIIREVYRAFTTLTGLADGASQKIEDLADLSRLDSALTVLNQRQGELGSRQQAAETRQEALEHSQQQARVVWLDLQKAMRDIHERIDALESQQTGTLSRAQRGYIYQLVQAWGAAKAEREPRLSRSGAFAACWTAFKLRYRIARYEDLPAKHYHEAVAFVRQSYRTLTGVDLELPEQQELPLGDV